MNKKKKLFDLLIKFGFEKTEDNKKVIFKNDDEIFVYPQAELQEHHYTATRKHLDMNGWIEKCEFDLIFDEEKKLYTIMESGQEHPEVCRVCGSKKVHSKKYGKPTMECIKFLKEKKLSRRFPMVDGPDIDWATAKKIYEIYSLLHTNSQTLERIAERGGFGWSEVSQMAKKAKRVLEIF